MNKQDHEDWYAGIKAAMAKHPYDVLITGSGHQWNEGFQRITLRENLLQLRSKMGEDGSVNVIVTPAVERTTDRALHLSVANPDVVTNVINPWLKEICHEGDGATIIVYPEGGESYVVDQA